MIFLTSRRGAKARGLPAGFCLAFAGPALAQRAAVGEIDASADVGAPDVNDEDILKDIDVSKLDWTQLDVDASTLKDGPAAKARTARRSDGGGPDWSNRNQANGSSAVSVKQSVSPFWDARVGADMTVTREPATMS